MQLLPALIFRINRCNADDKKVIEYFLKRSLAPTEDGQAGFSILVCPPLSYSDEMLDFILVQVELNNNLAELWSSLAGPHDSMSCGRMKGMSENTFTATHVMPDIYCPIESEGVVGYPTDQYYRKYPSNKIDIPVLLLHGEYCALFSETCSIIEFEGDMDQALPVSVARHFYKHYSKVNKKLIYIELPRTGHTATSA